MAISREKIHVGPSHQGEYKVNGENLGSFFQDIIEDTFEGLEPGTKLVYINGLFSFAVSPHLSIDELEQNKNITIFNLPSRYESNYNQPDLSNISLNPQKGPDIA